MATVHSPQVVPLPESRKALAIVSSYQGMEQIVEVRLGEHAEISLAVWQEYDGGA
jgi:hypothetical protein